MATTYQDRYENARPSYIKTNNKRFADLPAGSTILIPSPQDIEAEINRLAPEQTLTFTELRGALAERHDADGSCPVMTGMNLKIVVGANADLSASGVPDDQLVPTWKVIR